jgi:hypothetical protein
MRRILITSTSANGVGLNQELERLVGREGIANANAMVVNHGRYNRVLPEVDPRVLSGGESRQVTFKNADQLTRVAHTIREIVAVNGDEAGMTIEFPDLPDLTAKVKAPAAKDKA